MTNNKKHVPLTKKAVLVTAAICALITGFWVGTQCPDMQKMGGYYALAVTFITALQFWEKRNSHWEWGYVIFLCAFYFALAGVLIVLAEELKLYWCFALWAAAAVACVALAIASRSKKGSKKSRKEQKTERL